MQKANSVFFMQRGILKEFGSFNDLIARKGEFAQIAKRVLEDMKLNDENDTIQDCKYPTNPTDPV